MAATAASRIACHNNPARKRRFLAAKLRNLTILAEQNRGAAPESGLAKAPG
jgi:hypothetical protein